MRFRLGDYMQEQRGASLGGGGGDHGYQCDQLPPTFSTSSLRHCLSSSTFNTRSTSLSNFSSHSATTQDDCSSPAIASQCYSSNASVSSAPLSSPNSASWYHGSSPPSLRLSTAGSGYFAGSRVGERWIDDSGHSHNHRLHAFPPPTAELDQLLSRFAEEHTPWSGHVASHDQSWLPINDLSSQLVTHARPAARHLSGDLGGGASVEQKRERENGPAYHPTPPRLSPLSVKPEKYKTELCRSWEEQGHCRYGGKCQYAHGQEELRGVERHPKYKTELCRSFYRTGSCPYAKRCVFVHSSSLEKAQSGREDEISKTTLLSRVGVKSAQCSRLSGRKGALAGVDAPLGEAAQQERQGPTMSATVGEKKMWKSKHPWDWITTQFDECKTKAAYKTQAALYDLHSMAGS